MWSEFWREFMYEAFLKKIKSGICRFFTLFATLMMLNSCCVGAVKIGAVYYYPNTQNVIIVIDSSYMPKDRCEYTKWKNWKEEIKGYCFSVSFGQAEHGEWVKEIDINVGYKALDGKLEEAVKYLDSIS